MPESLSTKRVPHDPSKCPWAGCIDCHNVEAQRDTYREALRAIASMGDPLDTMAPISSFSSAQRIARSALEIDSVA